MPLAAATATFQGEQLQVSAVLVQLDGTPSNSTAEWSGGKRQEVHLPDRSAVCRRHVPTGRHPSTAPVDAATAAANAATAAAAPAIEAEAAPGDTLLAVVTWSIVAVSMQGSSWSCLHIVSCRIRSVRFSATNAGAALLHSGRTSRQSAAEAAAIAGATQPTQGPSATHGQHQEEAATSAQLHVAPNTLSQVSCPSLYGWHCIPNRCKGCPHIDVAVAGCWQVARRAL